MICFAFPLAHEAGLVLKRCTAKEPFTVEGLNCTMADFRGRQILIAEVGMGQAQARKNTQTLFNYFRPKAFILSGYGGALVPALKVGQVVVSTNFSSPEVLTFLRLLSGFDFASFCTTDELVGTQEKRDWYARSTKTQVADMETAAVAGIVEVREIPMISLRVISDDHRQMLPVGALAAGFNATKGHATPLRLLGYLTLHPQEIAPFKRFVSGLSLARKNLTNFLQQLNDELPRGW
jgi:adenosylhomocysteine nucleosidase